MRKIISILLAVLCFMFVFTGCKKEEEKEKKADTTVVTLSDTSGDIQYGNADMLYHFRLEFRNSDGNFVSYNIYSNEQTLGKALSNIFGEIKINSNTIDFKGRFDTSLTDGEHWVFAVNGKISHENPYDVPVDRGNEFNTFSFVDSHFVDE